MCSRSGKGVSEKGFAKFGGASPAGVTIKENCYDRFFPGDGEFPNVEVVQILAEKGALNEVGPEVFSPMLDSMSVEQVAEKSSQSIGNVRTLAGVNS